MSTGLDTFDKTVQESNLWLKDIMDRLYTTDRHRGLYYEGWDPTDKPTKERHQEAFLAHIARELPRAEEGEGEQAILAVLDVLSKHIDRGAAVKIAGMFPQDLRKYWPAFIQEVAKERQQRAA
jgi:uncharacterized protein (DUF2267 family)